MCSRLLGAVSRVVQSVLQKSLRPRQRHRRLRPDTEFGSWSENEQRSAKLAHSTVHLVPNKLPPANGEKLRIDPGKKPPRMVVKIMKKGQKKWPTFSAFHKWPIWREMRDAYLNGSEHGTVAELLPGFTAEAPNTFPCPY